MNGTTVKLQRIFNEIKNKIREQRVQAQSYGTKKKYKMPNEKYYFCKYKFRQNQVIVCIVVVFMCVCMYVWVCSTVFYKQVSMLDISVISVGYGGILNTFWMSFSISSICFSCETRNFSFSRACLIWAFYNDKRKEK